MRSGQVGLTLKAEGQAPRRVRGGHHYPVGSKVARSPVTNPVSRGSTGGLGRDRHSPERLRCLPLE